MSEHRIWLMNTSHKAIINTWFIKYAGKSAKEKVKILNKKHKSRTYEQYIRTLIQFGVLEPKTNVSIWVDWCQEIVLNFEININERISNIEDLKKLLSSEKFNLWNKDLKKRNDIVSIDAKYIFNTAVLFTFFIDKGVEIKTEKIKNAIKKYDLIIKSKKDDGIVNAKRITKEMRNYEITYEKFGIGNFYKNLKEE